mgnify:FL=1
MKCAIVDLGSNTIRLSLYNTLNNGGFETLFSKKYMAGLAGYVSHGIMSNDGINQACAVLLDFKILLQQLGINEMHVFATASLRNIKNTEKALETIKRRTGLSVDVIAGSEEGILGYYGALYTTDLKNGIMFDIGGGSTEFVRIKNGKVKKSQSISIGSLNLFHNHVSGLWPDKKEQKAISKRIAKRLDMVEFPKKSPEKVCCVGGTCRAILNIVNYHFNKQENNRIITKEEFDKILKILTKRNTLSRNYILKLCPDRVHTIIPGMLVAKEVMEQLHCKELWVSRYGVREGYLCKNFLMTDSEQEIVK